MLCPPMGGAAKQREWGVDIPQMQDSPPLPQQLEDFATEAIVMLVVVGGWE